MKNILFFLLVFVLVFYNSCNSKPSGDAGNKNTPNDSIKSISVVSGFLSWYKKEYESIQSIYLIKNDENGFYRIDKSNTDLFLLKVKSSAYFSDKFIDNFREYLEAIDKKLVENKQNDGPPQGLEADLFLYCQYQDIIFDNIDSVQYNYIKQNSKIKVELIYTDELDLLFELNNKFQIEKITPNIKF